MHQQIMLAQSISSGGPPGGFPVYEDATPSSNGTATTSHTINMPATVNAGDLLVIQFGTVLVATSFAGPAGWTELFEFGTSGASSMGVYWKIASGSEGGTTVTITSTASATSAAITHRIQAGTFNTGTPLAQANSNGNSTIPDPPNLNAPWGSANTLWIVSYTQQRCSTVSVYPYPDGNTVAVSNPGSTANTDQGTGSCWVESATTSLDPGLYTLSQSRTWIAATIAVQPN